MKKNCLSILLKRGWICGSIIVKNVPREYVRNYSVEGVKVPRSLSLFKHDPWIVFANEPGTTYLSPSGKNEMRPVNYMDAFLVIKQRRLASIDPV